MKTNILVKLFSVIVFVKSGNTESIRPDIISHPNWNLLDQGEDCGTGAPHFRIIGGTEASLGQLPWIARLGYTTDKTSKEVEMFECGGAILNNIYIITAAHCGPDVMNANLVGVAVGEHDTRTDPDCRNGICAPPVQYIEVESVSCHENYGKKTFENDICMVRLERPIAFNDYVQPICLPIYDSFLSNNFNGEIMEVAGWGVIDIRTYSTSLTLQTLKVSVVPFDQCVKQFKAVKINDKQMCAGGTVGQDSCAGDSGGPLMKPFSINGPPRYFLVGVVSFGATDCAATKLPGVYTKVADYLIWVLDHVRP